MSFEFIDTASAALAASINTTLPVSLDPAAGTQDAAGSAAMLTASDLAGESASQESGELLATGETDQLSLSDEDITAMSDSVVSRGGEPDLTQPLDQVPTESDTIVVTGSRHRIEAGGGGNDFYQSGGIYFRYDGGDPSSGESSGLGMGQEVAAPADEDRVEIAVNFDPTPEQKEVIKRFEQAVEQALKAVKALPDNAKLTLENGSTVSGAELKALVAKMDFTINPPNFKYQNESYRGESKYNGGDPKIGLNIDLVEGYDKPHLPGGLVYLALHEVGHLAEASRDYAYRQSRDGPLSTDEIENHEEMANDIARAVADAVGLPTLANPGDGYSSDAVLEFRTGGGGGGGGEYDEHVSY